MLKYIYIYIITRICNFAVRELIIIYDGVNSNYNIYTNFDCILRRLTMLFSNKILNVDTVVINLFSESQQ